MAVKLVSALCLVLAIAPAARAVDPPIIAQSVVSAGLNGRVTSISSAPGDYTRLWLAEQSGRVRLLKNGALQPGAFLDLSVMLAPTQNWVEYGLLGLAFHPDYIHNGYFYVVYTPGNSTMAHWTLARYRVNPSNPDVADPASAQVILSVTYTQKPHRAGWVAFGPDGYLYAATGDGGEDDPDNAASNILASSPLSWRGKVLRIDVNGPDGLPGTPDDDAFPADPNRNYVIPDTNPFAASATNRAEIWAYGFRNPWRGGFDRLTGDIWLGDVGQAQREEIDLLPAGVGGRFYGWRCKEGSITSLFAECTGALPASIPPVLDYPRSGTPSGSSVTGGYVYRGCAMPALQGAYFFADWVSGRVFTFRYSPAVGMTNLTERGSELTNGASTLVRQIACFGEDAFGELYYYTGFGATPAVYKIVPRTPGADCNANSIADACELAQKLLHDRNHNTVPDECEPGFCLPDIATLGGGPGPDHALTVDDLVFYLDRFFANDLNVADISGLGGTSFPDGRITPDDLVDCLAAFFAGCP
ncbi:MAG: PQQ-dependent sugar dehydrogenase [Phycisphaerales bacterium]